MLPLESYDQANREVDALFNELWMEAIQTINAKGPLIEQLAAELVETPENALVLTAAEMAASLAQRALRGRIMANALGPHRSAKRC
jgi:hypothetical protein